MNLRTITRPKVFIPMLLTAALALGTAATVGASGQRDKTTKAERPTAEVMKDIRAGKAKQLPVRGPGTRLHGVWNGCRFVYLTTQVSDWQFDDGSIASVNDNPQAMPPSDCPGPSRNPTEGEMNAMHAVVGAHNNASRPEGSPAPPPTPRARHLEGS